MNAYYVIPTPLVFNICLRLVVVMVIFFFFYSLHVRFQHTRAKSIFAHRVRGATCRIPYSTVVFMLIFVPHFSYYMYFLLVLTCFNVPFIIITTTSDNNNSY